MSIVYVNRSVVFWRLAAGYWQLVSGGWKSPRRHIALPPCRLPSSSVSRLSPV